MDTRNKEESTNDSQIKQIENELEIVHEEQKQRDERKRLLSLYEGYDDVDRVVSFKSLFEELKERNINDKCIKTNIPKLDKKTDGFRNGNVIVVSGTTGSGKTTLLQTFVKEFSSQDIPSLFFTYEVPPLEFLRKFEYDMPKLAYLPKQHKDSKMVWLEQRILEGMAKYKTKVVMIDHLHYLLDMKMLGGNTSLLIGGIMRELKRISIEYGIIIFLVAHTKKVKFSGDEMPDLTALRDSGMVACEADYVLFIDRKMKEDKMNWDNRAMLFVAKNRWSGNTGWIQLIYVNNKFSEEIKIDYKEDKNVNT